MYNVIFKKIVYQVTIYWKSGLLNGHFFIPITLQTCFPKNFIFNKIYFCNFTKPFKIGSFCSCSSIAFSVFFLAIDSVKFLFSIEILLKFSAKDICSEAATRGVLWKKVFLEISKNIQENTCVRVSFFRKLQALGLATLLKKRLRYRCFPVNFAKFLSTSFLQNTSGWLLLYVLEKVIHLIFCIFVVLSYFLT